MKRRSTVIAALAVSLLAPLPLLAQGGGQNQGGRGMGAMSARLLVEQGSVEYLVTRATDLSLSADQTQKLQSIGAAWSESTKASREEIRGKLPQQGQMGGDREAMMQRMQELRPLAEKLAETDQKALTEALAQLDATQQEKAKSLLEERRQNARPRRGGGR